MLKRLLLLTVALCLWASASSPVSGNDPSGIADLLNIQNRLQEALPRAKAATVAVGYGGSGVIVSEDGYVLSAAHVTQRPGRPVKLTLHDGREVSAETLGASRFADAGLLKITEEGDWPFTPLAPADSTEIGDWCYALGHSGGYDPERGPVVRIGRVIAMHRNMMRTDCQLIGGDSGGPLFNLDGEVIGIHSRVSEEIDRNYHSPVEAFHRTWDLLIAGEWFPKQSGRGGGFLGVQTAGDESGVLIEELVEDSAAERALLQSGDIITHVDEYPIAAPEELALAISSRKPGEEVTIRYRRNEQERTIKVELGSRPERDTER